MNIGDSVVNSIGVIGGGFSGSLFAYHLKNLNPTQKITIFEPHKILGRGVAFSTTDKGHVLNVAASKMSALLHKPDDFVEYLRRTYKIFRNKPHEFFSSYYAPRKIYGDYIESKIKQTNIDHICEPIIDIDYEADERITFKTHTNKKITFDYCVMANGIPHSKACNQLFKYIDKTRYLAKPWSDKARTKFMSTIKKDSSIFILGSALTMVDMVISLKENGHNGPITVLSRRGLLPKGHKVFEAKNILWDKTYSPLSLCQAIRKEVSQNNGNWHEIIDSLRPYSKDIWQQFSPLQKRQFLRHLRPYWDVHRHRIAPHVEKIIRSAKLKILKGNIKDAQMKENKIILEFHHKGKSHTTSCDFLINCIGTEGRVVNFEGDLWSNLLKKEIARSDETGIAPDLASDFSLLSKKTKSKIFVLGALRRGYLWESVAVPELREQAYELAKKFTH